MAIAPDRYQKALEHQFDECHNAYTKPKAPVSLSPLLNEGLHKRSDFA